MRRLYCLLSVLILLPACNHHQDMPADAEYVNEIKATISGVDAIYEDDFPLTKTSLTNDDEFIWTANDTLGIYPDAGSQVYFVISEGAQSSTAYFDGGGWGLKTGHTYYSYYPFVGNIYLDRTRIPVSYNGQKQIGTTGRNFGPYDFMYAPGVYASGSSLSFSYKHLNCYLYFYATLPAGTYTKLTMATEDPLLVEEGYFDLTAEQPAIVPTKYTDQLTMDLESFTVTDSSPIKIYMMLAPVNLNGQTVYVRVLDSENVERQCIKTPSRTYEASKIYGLSCASWTTMVSSISLDRNTLNLELGTIEALIPILTPLNCSDPVIWTTDNASVATVEDGVVTANSIGTATITAKAGNKSATCLVTVTPVTVLSLALDKDSVTMKVGDTTTLNATVNPSYAPLTWTSSDDTIVTVFNGVITALKSGNATITVTSGDKTAQCNVQVSDSNNGIGDWEVGDNSNGSI